jgi:hypothetical protein
MATNWFGGIIAALQVLPALIETITALTAQVEHESPAKSGAAKKAAVMGMVSAGLAVSDQFDDEGTLTSERQKAAIVKLAGEATDVVVGLRNAVGAFSKSDASR